MCVRGLCVVNGLTRRHQQGHRSRSSQPRKREKEIHRETEGKVLSLLSEVRGRYKDARAWGTRGTGCLSTISGFREAIHSAMGETLTRHTEHGTQTHTDSGAGQQAVQDCGWLTECLGFLPRFAQNTTSVDSGRRFFFGSSTPVIDSAYFYHFRVVSLAQAPFPETCSREHPPPSPSC